MIEYNENISTAQNYVERDKVMNLNPQEVCRNAMSKLKNLGMGKDMNQNYWKECNDYSKLLNFYNFLSEDALDILGW